MAATGPTTTPAAAAGATAAVTLPTIDGLKICCLGAGEAAAVGRRVRCGLWAGDDIAPQHWPPPGPDPATVVALSRHPLGGRR